MRKYMTAKKRLFLTYIITVPFMSCTSVLFAKSMGPLLDEAILKSGEKAYVAIWTFVIMGLLDLLASFC